MFRFTLSDAAYAVLLAGILAWIAVALAGIVAGWWTP